ERPRLRPGGDGTSSADAVSRLWDSHHVSTVKGCDRRVIGWSSVAGCTNRTSMRLHKTALVTGRRFGYARGHEPGGCHQLTEREEAVRVSRRGEEVIEIVGVLLLAVAAVATAWGGF